MVLTNESDRIEVEWKYLLALDPVDSERPKPSANAKPLPEHLKENDASLAITNRTDGVPEVGDPFQDPNAEQKWAEFNTAPEVTLRVAKVDFSKPERLWYYLGKTSTEARPQYTEDPAKPKHNPKSNFLDTVKPAPLPIPAFERRSYPASYPIKPSPVSIPRTPMQSQARPTEKPYQYKPKVETTYRPVYNYSPDTRKNPNSPVAHQPNVVYDHRATTPQYGYPSHSNTYNHHRPSTTFHHYVPPQTSASSTSWKPTSGPMLSGIDQYAPTNQSTLPPYPYYQASAPNAPRQVPPVPYSQSQPPATSRNAAPLANVLSNPAGASKSPMYANAPSSISTTQSPLSQSEYLAYVTKYPYLKNAFLRRAKTYISPYSPDGGFTPEWMPKPPGSTITTPGIAPRPLSSSSSNRPAQGLGLSFTGGPPPGLPPPRPMPQFQSPDAFQRDMAKAPIPATPVRWESMMKQLNKPTVPGNPSNPTTPLDPALHPKSSTPPVLSTTPPLPPPNEPQRPIPSPISDAPKSPKRPEYSPISDDGKGPANKATLPQIHSGETWRYS